MTETARARGRPNAFLLYEPQGYSTAGTTVMGIQAANEGFLKGFIRHGGVDPVCAAVGDEAAGRAFVEMVRQESPRPAVKAVSIRRPDLLAELDALYLPGPGLGEYAWQRRQFDQRGYSLCGVTHAMAQDRVMDAVLEFALAPVQRWDALVCTSTSIRQAIEALLGDWQTYLGERLNASAPPLPQMPVLPLGIDCAAVAAHPARRAEGRRRLGIGDDDVAVLYFGRLNHRAKAHPVPLYQALEMAAARSGRRLHLLQAGWFAGEEAAQAFRQAAREFCPSVTLVCLDGREPSIRTGIWSVADLFVSLPDNIQESFGLTPLEAMAAGLPVVVSDWDGYRDSVRHGIDGFRVTTLMPPAPHGADLSYAYGAGIASYDEYVGETAQFVAIDLGETADAIAALAKDAGLRRRMGEAGSRRARETYDWSVIVPAYQALWQELTAMRGRAPEAMARRPGMSWKPARPDPFAAFAGFPSRLLAADDRILAAGGLDRYDAVRASPLVRFAEARLPEDGECRHLLAHLERAPATVAELAARFPADRQGIVLRGIAWLAKFGLVRVAPRGP